LIVLFCPDQIASERSLPDVVAAEIDVHEARHDLARVGVLVVLHPLDEGRGAVADADDRDPHFVALTQRAVR
jgi:hypothetical protein